MRNIISVVILVFITITLAWGLDNALSKSIYPGCQVLEQDGQILTIKLDSQLCTGTDTACQRAGKLILNICQDGYLVLVNDSDGWAPAAGHVINQQEAVILAFGY